MRQKTKARSIIAAIVAAVTALGAVVLAVMLFKAIAVPSPEARAGNRPIAFSRAARPQDALPAGTTFRADGADDGADDISPLDSRLLLDNGAARYWIVLLPKDQERSICIMLQSSQERLAATSCATPQRFAERGVGVVLKSSNLAFAGLITPQTVVLPEDTIFESRGQLIYRTVAAGKADELVTDLTAMKDEISR